MFEPSKMASVHPDFAKCAEQIEVRFNPFLQSKLSFPNAEVEQSFYLRESGIVWKNVLHLFPAVKQLLISNGMKSWYGPNFVEITPGLAWIMKTCPPHIRTFIRREQLDQSLPEALYIWDKNLEMEMLIKKSWTRISVAPPLGDKGPV